MDLRVLGPVEVHDGYRRAIGGPRQRRILAVLAMRRGAVVSVDQLIDLSWPGDAPPAAAQANLRTYVHRLRSGMGDDLAARVVTTPGGYMLEAADDEIDAARFERFIDRGDRLIERHDAEGTLDQVEQALRLWHGDPYGEFAGEAWAEAEIMRLLDLRVRADELRCQALVHLGRDDEAVSLLDSLIDAHPYRERPRRLQMLALYRSGRQAEALRAYQRFRRLLVDELGVEPSTELAELEQRMLAQDPALRQTEEAAPVLRSYREHRVLGEGAHAIVWQCTQAQLGREVAVKQLRPAQVNDPEFIRRFEIEAQLVASLEHPHIVPLYDYWREPDAAFLVFRLMSGGSLAERLRRGPLSDEQVVRLIGHVGAALAHAHRCEVTHGDIRPANVLLDDEDNFYLADFGIARRSEEHMLPADRARGAGAVHAPTSGRDGPAVDIAAFGRLVRTAAITNDEQESPQLPAWLGEIVRRCTTADPADRYRSMADLLADAGDRVGSEIDLRSPDRRPVVVMDRIGGDSFTLSADLRNPFKGLRAFQESDAALFHGRARLVDRLLEVLKRPGPGGRLVAVVGPSGSGKSSVVRAGLVPALRAGAIAGSEDWFVTTMVPGVRPFDELEAGLTRIAANPPGPLSEIMAADAQGIGRAVRMVVPDDASELVVLVDQFEELFTQVAGAQRQRFLDGLLEAVRHPRGRLRVVLTIRADFWDRPLRHGALATLLEEAAVTVGPMSADELREAIVGPVADQGLEYERGLVERIIVEIIDQPGALPLLQYALTALFDTSVSGLIQAQAYDDMGGVAGALANRAEESLAALAPEGRVAARRVFGRLVSLGEGSDDTRRRVFVNELTADPATRSVLDVFVAARLLTVDADPATRLPTVEIAHEALFGTWPRLADWIDEDRDHLRLVRRVGAAATDWDQAGRPTDQLYRGGRLESAAEIAALDPPVLNELERAFVHAGQAAAEADQRRTRRRTRVLQGLLAATGVFLVVALVAALVAVNRATEADEARTSAEQSEAAAQEAQVAAEQATADLALDVRRDEILDLVDETAPIVPTLLAVELHERSPGPAALDTVARTLLGTEGWLGTLPGQYPTWASHGPWLVTVERTQLVVRNPVDLTEIRTIAIDPFPDESPPRFFAAVVAPDGRRMVFEHPGGLSVVDLATGTIGEALDISPLFPTEESVAWTPDGSHLIVPIGPDAFQLVEVDALALTAGPVLEHGLGLDGPMLAVHPFEPELAVSSRGTVATFDLSELDDGTLPVTYVRDLSTTEVGASFLSYASDGRLFTPVFGRDELNVIDDGVVGSLEGLPPAANWLDARSVGDGEVFVSRWNGDDAMIVDEATGQVVAGPWSAPAAGGYVQPQLVANGDAIALASDLGEIHVWSLVGGNPFSRTLPPVDSGRPMYLLPESDVVGDVFWTDVWRVAGDSYAPIDFGVANRRSVMAAPTAEGDRAFVIDRAGKGSIHELPSGAAIGPAFDLGPQAEFGVVSADARHVVVQDPKGMVVFDAASGAELGRFDHGRARSDRIVVQGELAGVVGTPSSGSGGVINTVLVVDLSAMEQVFLGDGYLSDFTPDGTGFFSVTDGPSVELVDLATGEPGWRLVDAIFANLLPSGNHVVSFFGEVSFHSYPEGEPIGPPIAGDGAMPWADGVLTQRRDGRYHVWNIDVETWPDVACEAAGRNLTRGEWEAHMQADTPYEPSCPQWPVDA